MTTHSAEERDQDLLQRLNQECAALRQEIRSWREALQGAQQELEVRTSQYEWGLKVCASQHATIRDLTSRLVRTESRYHGLQQQAQDYRAMAIDLAKDLADTLQELASAEAMVATLLQRVLTESGGAHE